MSEHLLLRVLLHLSHSQRKPLEIVDWVKAHEWHWCESMRLYMFFVWYFSKVLEANNIKAYKGEKSINYERFKRFITIDFPVDRTCIQQFNDILAGIDEHSYPKNYEIVKASIDEVLKRYVVEFKSVL